MSPRLNGLPRDRAAGGAGLPKADGNPKCSNSSNCSSNKGGVRICATASVQWSSTPYGYEQCIHRGAFQNQLRLGRIGRFQNLKSSRPQPLSVCRTEDCIFFHDQDDRFFRKGHRSTTRLKQEDPGSVLLNLLQCLVTSCVIENFSIFGNA